MSIPSENTQKKIGILMVEDSPTQAVQLQYILENEGYLVTHARNGAEAIEQLNKSLPSLIISDVVMPIMDGYEFCRAVKDNARMRHVPIILLTTLSDPGDIFKGLESGADHYAIKPYDEELLISRIKSVLADQYLRSASKSQMGLEITYGGHKYFINADRIQILDLLLATFENVVRKNKELERTNQQLKESLETNKVLRGLIPICSYCKKIRDDKGFWQMVEKYMQEHTAASFSHGICPDCAKVHFPEFYPSDNKE